MTDRLKKIYATMDVVSFWLARVYGFGLPNQKREKYVIKGIDSERPTAMRNA